jgi:hypothetical protein
LKISLRKGMNKIIEIKLKITNNKLYRMTKMAFHLYMKV